MSIYNYLNLDQDGFFYDPGEGRLFQVKEVEIVREDATDYKVRSKLKSFKGQQRLCTHIIFFLMTGRWPIELIDHKDNNPWNNRWNNLREATKQQNAQNRQPGSHSSDLTLEPGVFLTPSGGYRVRVAKVNFGVYETKQEANIAAIKARKELYGEFAQGVE